MRASLSPIILAQEPDFHLGGLRVSPSKLQVVCGATQAGAALQPRIMQLFVVLAQRRGEVVSRDEMMGFCWGGFAVSDDAINRCIARIRRLSQIHGGFTLETIPRVGYRLSEKGQPAMAPEAKAESEDPQTPAPQMQAARGLASYSAVAALGFAAGVLVSAAVFMGAHMS